MGFLAWLRKQQWCVTTALTLAVLLIATACTGSAGANASTPGVEDNTITIGAVLDPIFSAYKFYGYINAKLFTDALNKAGQNPTRDSLRNALNQDFVNYDTGFGPTLTWSSSKHGGVSDFMFFQIKNGQLAPVSQFIKSSSVWP